MWSSCGPLSARLTGIHLKGNFLPSPPFPTPSRQPSASAFSSLKKERGRDSQLAETPLLKATLFHLRAKQWDTDSAVHIPMPLFGDDKDSEQNKKKIWMLLKVVGQTDSGCFPSGNKISKWSQCGGEFWSVYSIVLHAEYNRVLYRKGWSFKEGISNSQIVGF